MAEEVERKIRFALSETKEIVLEQIINVIPELKIEWKILKDEQDKKEFFRSNIGNIMIDVHEDYVDFHLKFKTIEEETRRYETFKKVGNNRIRKKISLYNRIVERIKQDDEVRFYKRILRSMNGHLNSQKERNEFTFTESTEDIETDN
jgi:hypothetical protein